MNKNKIVRIDTGKDGSEIVTLEDEHGQLQHTLKKLVPKELLAEYKGEVTNRYKE